MNLKTYNIETKLKEYSKTVLSNWVWVVIFAIAFAWVESAVVVYLRKIYFNGGFSFPLTVNYENGKHVFDPLVRIELGREIATIIILLSVGIIAGRKKIHQFCFFMIGFGIWDIFYYIWLVVMVGWPESLMTWDLLFYVPLPWVGPVITPVLIAIAMTVECPCVSYRPGPAKYSLLGLEEYFAGPGRYDTHGHSKSFCVGVVPAGLFVLNNLFCCQTEDGSRV